MILGSFIRRQNDSLLLPVMLLMLEQVDSGLHMLPPCKAEFQLKKKPSEKSSHRRCRCEAKAGSLSMSHAGSGSDFPESRRSSSVLPLVVHLTAGFLLW